MNVWKSVKELQLLCERLDFKHIYNLKKLLFLYKLVRINNSVLKACYDMFSHSVEFTLLCYSFDIALDLCSEVEIRSKVFSAFNHILYSRWLLLKLTVCFYCTLFLYCILSVLIVCLLLLMANKLHHWQVYTTKYCRRSWRSMEKMVTIL